MANRKRKFVLRVPVTPEERALIQQKMAQLGTKNFSAYARKMLIDGYIVHIDTGPVRAQTAELQKIGVNINQIARRINSRDIPHTHKTGTSSAGGRNGRCRSPPALRPRRCQNDLRPASSA